MVYAWKKTLREILASSERVVILGVGNPDRGDDAAGVLCAGYLMKKLEKNPLARIKVLYGFDTPENCTSAIRKFKPTHVIIIDSAAAHKRPGDIFIVDRSRIADDGVSTHLVSLVWLLKYIEESIGARPLLLGIQPKTTRPGTLISEPARKAAKRLADGLFKLLSP